jgi:carboxyl-terminal processing protease
MKSSRYVLLTASVVLVLAMLASGMAVRVGAEDGSYRETVQFAEIMSTILEYYVDPVEAEALLEGAYKGMLGGLDPNGAYLTPEEVADWLNTDDKKLEAGPGLSVLKVGRTVQVVAIEPDSATADAGVRVGDHLRRLNGQLTRDLSLQQLRRQLRGEAGTEVQLELLRPGADFETQQLTLVRSAAHGRGYSVEVRQGIAVLRFLAPARIDADALVAELDDIRTRGITQLLLDLRNSSEAGPREIAQLAACFGAETALHLRDTKGRVTDSLEPDSDCRAWDGPIALLINGATAGAAEAFTLWVKAAESPVFGQSSYGLGAEPTLYELENGAGLLVSTAQWETPDGQTWNETGIDPDTVVEGEGDDYAEIQQDQLRRVLDQLEEEARQANAA